MIADELESELRDAYSRAAADIVVPDPARARLLSRDYHPRTVNRRLIAGVTAVAAVVASAAILALTVLAPASNRPGQSPTAQLAAWTVVTHADGTVLVTIREFRDPAGLQRKLRRDGIPASVTFVGHPPRACRRYPADGALINSVFTGRTVAHDVVMVIHPSALPDAAGVAIRPPAQQPITNVAIGLVHTSPHCTGS